MRFFLNKIYCFVFNTKNNYNKLEDKYQSFANYKHSMINAEYKHDLYKRKKNFENKFYLYFCR